MANGEEEKATPPVISDDLGDYGETGESMGGGIPWNANTKPVVLGKLTGATADRYERNDGQFNVRTVYDLTRSDASGWLTQLRANNRNEYDALMGQLRSAGYLGPRANSISAQTEAFKDAANEASARYLADETENVDVIDYILSQAQAGGSGGSGGSGGGGYSGPTASRTMMAESDIRATANALAIELIGRPVDDKELEKITRRMRTAEVQQPQITTSTVGSSVTQQGLTSQGREDILRELISENPEYEQFQVDTTVLDAMTGFINKKKQVSGG